MRLAVLEAKVLTGAMGAEKYLAALASGDVADDAAVEARRDICRGCASRTRWIASGWCGPALSPQAEPPTCGCLLRGKTLVASEACPQGKWGAAERAATMP